MNILQKRFLAFLLACIPVRVLFVYIAKNISPIYLPYLGLLALLPAIGFLSIYFGGYRKKGGETFGQKIWWNDLRPVHGLLYICFSYLAINKNKRSYVPLLIDVVIGLFSFIIFHFYNGSFKKLIV